MKFNRIKIILVEKDLQQMELANHLGKSKTTIYQWCNNRSQPSPEDFRKISDFLNVPLRELLVDYRPNQEQKE